MIYFTNSQMQLIDDYREWLKGATVRNPSQAFEKYLKEKGYDANAKSVMVDDADNDELIQIIDNAMDYAHDRCGDYNCCDCPLDMDETRSKGHFLCSLPFVKEYFDKNKLCIIKKED